MKLSILLSSVSLPVAFMSMPPLDTVTIVTDNGPVRINKTDYDAAPDQYKLADEAPATLRDDGPTIAEFVAAGYPAANYPPRGYASKSSEEEIAAAVAAEAAKTNEPKPEQPAGLDASLQSAASGAPAPQLMVMKDGKKHFVVDPAGVKVERDGIDAAGYANEKEAWDAILALPK